MSLLDLPNGLHEGIPSEDYHAPILGMVSKGGLEQLSRSPAHYRAWLAGVGDEDTDAFRFGRGFHCATLEPDRFEDFYRVEPKFGDCRKTDNKARRDAWRAENAGREILSHEEMESIVGMAKALRAHPLAGAALRDGLPELTALWQDEETGLRCRCRADYYVKKLRTVFDVKTTQDARDSVFVRDAFKYRYHWQHALYRAGFAAVGEEVLHFAFIAIEKTPPYGIGIYTLDDRGITNGHLAVRREIRRMAECMRTDTWPSYEVGIRTLDTPGWID